MRSATRVGFIVCLSGAVVAAVACGDDEPARGLESEPDSGPLPPIRAGAQTNGSEGGTSASATMRFAHLAKEMGPVDFCYQLATSGTFVGPVLGGPAPPAVSDAETDADAGESDADADAGEPDAGEPDADAGPVVPSVSYGTVTKYIGLAAGPITIALIEGGSRSCANPIARGEITLDPGKLSTVALFARPGDGGVALELTAFTDDRTTPNDKIRVRVIHGALGTSTDPPAGLLAVRANAAKTTVLADKVEPRRAAMASDAIGVDAFGYVTAAPVPPPTTISIGAASADAGSGDAGGNEPWLSKPNDLGLTGGSVHTAFVLPGRAGAPFAVLWCADTVTDGDRTTCFWIH